MVRLVRKGVRSIALLLVWSAAVPAWAAEAHEVRLYPATVEWGRHVTLSLPVALQERVDWRPVDRCFAREVVQAGSDRIRYRLYAYRPGVCEWPAQAEGLPAARIEVLPNEAVSVVWHRRPPEQGWIRQALYWTAEVVLKAHATGSRFGLVPPVSAHIYRVSPMQSERSSGQVFAVAWVVRPGVASLPGPWLQVESPSGRRWRFPAPPHRYEARPLPVWLPADVSVGVLQAGREIHDVWVERGGLFQVTSWLEAQDVMPGTLPSSLAESSSMAHAKVWTRHQVTEQWRDGRFFLIRRVEETLQAQAWGPLTLPVQFVRYFDPESGRLNQQVLPERNIWSLPAWSVVLGGLIAGIMGLAGLFLGIRQLWRLSWDGWLAWQRHRLAGEPLALWGAMQRWALRRGGLGAAPPVPMTPNSWLSRLPAHRRTRWRSLVERINAALYRKKPPERDGNNSNLENKMF